MFIQLIDNKRQIINARGIAKAIVNIWNLNCVRNEAGRICMTSYGRRVVDQLNPANQNYAFHGSESEIGRIRFFTRYGFLHSTHERNRISVPLLFSVN